MKEFRVVEVPVLPGVLEAQLALAEREAYELDALPSSVRQLAIDCQQQIDREVERRILRRILFGV